MCEPVTIATVGAIAAGTAISAYSQYKSGKFAEAQANTNATVAGYQRADAIQRGTYQAGEVMQEGRRVASSARAALAASGVDSNTGSPSSTVTTSLVNAGVDAERVKSQAARQAWGFANEEQDLRAQARSARSAGILGSLGTGLSGIGTAAGTYRSMTPRPVP